MKKVNMGDLIYQQQTLSSWRTIFLLTAGVQVFSVLIFVIFGRTSVQPWNTYWEQEEEEEGKKKKILSQENLIRDLN